MASAETVSRLVVNERVTGQPRDGAARGPGVAEGVPRWQQVRILLVEFVLEAAERSFALDGSCQPAPSAFIGNLPGKVGHVLVPDVGGQ